MISNNILPIVNNSEHLKFLLVDHMLNDLTTIYKNTQKTHHDSSRKNMEEKKSFMLVLSMTFFPCALNKRL
jgi:hypothetical protein